MIATAIIFVSLGLDTLAVSLGLLIGQRLGKRLEERAEFAAGIVLALLGFAVFISEITGSHFV